MARSNGAGAGNGAGAAYGGAYAERYGGDPDKVRGQHGATARDGEDERPSTNLNAVERALSVAAGGALAAYGLKRRDWVGAAVGVAAGFLVERGVTGHCVAYDALGLTSVGDGDAPELPHHAEGGVTRQHGGTATVDAKRAQRVVQAFTIFGRHPGELYDYWRRLENLPRILQHLVSVEERDARRSHWVAKAPAGQTVAWDAEIINDVPGQIIAWRSLPGARVPNAGAVTFREAPAGRGTEVKVELSYEPPLGKLGAAVAMLFGEDPNTQVRADLRRYKQLLEAGEIPVSENPGQGERARHSFDAKVNRGETGGDVREAQDRAAADPHRAVHQPVPSDQARGANSTMTPKEPR